jgi:type I restriction enzyme, S subunit
VTISTVNIPQGWQKIRLKRIANLHPSKSEVASFPDDILATFLPMEAVSESWEVDYSRIRPLAEVRSGYTYFRDGDILVAKITPCFENGKGALVNGCLNKFGFGTTEFHVIRSPTSETTRFLSYVVRSHRFKFEGAGMMTGTAGQKRLSDDYVKDFEVFLPPILEREKIAHFLDRKTAAIDTLIAKKQRLIQLLEEKRTALINQAVTKGLNSIAPMKDSGIPWIGEIPEHWEIARLKWKITYVDQGRSPVCANRLADDGEWGVLKVGCVNGGVFNELEHKAFPEDLLKDFEHDIYKFQIHPGDILVSRANTKELVGSAARVGSIQSKLMLCDKLYRLHLSGKVDPEFLILILNSRLARCQFEQESSGASGSMQNISHDKLSNLLLPFPPSQTEQVKINTVFQERSLILQSSKIKLFEQIEKLQEYRRSLITAAVTGKIEIEQEVTSDHAC